ncbi:MAG: type II toxin-antitoxin system HigB family toxin [Pseudomonadota bacterium]
MQLLGLLKLEEFKQTHADSRGQLNAWQLEVESAQWKGPQDIKNRYPTASFLLDNRIIFNIKGNTYRLVVKVRYQNGIVLIEWIGTHAEYDKQDFRGRSK